MLPSAILQPIEIKSQFNKLEINIISPIKRKEELDDTIV